MQFPALNTTQFGYLKTRLPNKPKLKSTIYQPEVAADAIVNATDHDRREIMVGFSIIKAIIGNKIPPWYADWVLSRNGFDGQQNNELEDPDRKHNLWKTLPGDHGPHGTFGGKANRRVFHFGLAKTK